jgi:hypothetical protein
LDVPAKLAASPPTGAGHAAHGGAGAPAGSGLAMVLAAIGILLTASVAVLLFERLDESGSRTAVELGSLRTELRAGLDDLRDEIVDGERLRGDETRRVGTEVAGLAARMDEREKASAAFAAELREEVAELALRAGETAALADRLAEQDDRTRSIAASIAQMEADIGLLAEKVLELEERPVAPVLPAGPPAEAAPAADEPEWMALAADLASPSFNARYAAVTGLGDTQDPAVVPHLVPMLKDADLFVRMATARVLGDLRSMEAVPALIDALEDEEASVREQAVVSLRTLAKRTFGFDPTANQSDRSKKVKAWRDWWRRSGETEPDRT